MEEEEPAALQPSLRGSKGTGDAGDGATQPGQPLPGQHWDPSSPLPPTPPPQSPPLWHAEGRPVPRVTLSGWRRRLENDSPFPPSLFSLSHFISHQTFGACFTSLLCHLAEGSIDDLLKANITWNSQCCTGTTNALLVHHFSCNLIKLLHKVATSSTPNLLQGSQ